MNEAASVPALRKKIPWQNREQLGSSKAFFMTIFEAFFSPLDYFEKIEVRDDQYDPLLLSFYNSLSLASPLIAHMLLWSSFLAVIFIVVIVPVLLFFVAFLFHRILSIIGVTTSFKSTFYVLAFSTPAFALSYVPGVGYWFAGLFFTILAGIGLTTVHKLNFSKIFLALIFVPLVVMIPFGVVRFAQDWQVRHPVIDIEWEAQKVLSAVAVAAENHALKNDGRYPAESSILVTGPERYLVEDYCGQTIYSYHFSCDFRGFGYYLQAKPDKSWRARGKKIFYVTTGGKLREQQKE